MKRKNLVVIAFVGVAALLAGVGSSPKVFGDEAQKRDIIYVYPGGFIVGQFSADEKALGVRVLPLTDEMIEANEADLASCGLI